MTAPEDAEYLARPEGPRDSEITLQAQQGLPLVLPWGHIPVRLGTTFHSNRQSTNNPWSDETPFVLSDLHMIPKELHFEYGTTSTFKKVKTTTERETADHLTLGFGVGVGLPFLASASVKGTFDKDLQENTDSDKISLNACFRAGTIEFQRQPRLTEEAIIEIKYGQGYKGLCERYGDYYLAGYRLGGDTGIMMSSSGHTRKETDTYGITASVTVLFITASKHWDKDFKSFVIGRQIRLLGYDTLDGKTWKRDSAVGSDVAEVKAWGAFDEEADMNTLRGDTEEIMTRSENGLERIVKILDCHGYRNGESLTFSQCEALLTEGVVVELLLEPMWRLRDVVRWRMENNII
ncbi:hypothetical protein LEMA_P029870.1 [Plenodomus lingam JN3]|uniref:Uncharacterized protein n=1 Tax=Leptosphaeria maculans (strain JN3 / isolate v23.1.3 / race Av1-4-5-6-7-8) TaxID=985895 RepID=E4ZW59_LEPMJ|nr:hypothetical protein LEMA_P029870.1 [Plenodomus lingam JN3]CBX95835.1 hypothetical protein LEMA_P029870.1 [Plenodomus lingam JN3]